MTPLPQYKFELKRTSMSYARYLMCMKEGRVLDKNEHVDHIDGDKTNDSIENLQILTLKENNRKSLRERNILRRMVSLKCPACGRIFTRRKNITHLSKPNGVFTACSRSCSGKVRASMQAGHKFERELEENVIEIFEVPSVDLLRRIPSGS